jgi:hypothetical protein
MHTQFDTTLQFVYTYVCRYGIQSANQIREKKNGTGEKREKVATRTARDNGKTAQASPMIEQPQIEIKPLNFQDIYVDIEGTTELIMHKWSKKAKQMMLDKQMGKVVERKPKKDPEQDFQDSIYRLPDGGYGFPSAGFKAAIVSALRQYDKILPMVTAKVSIIVLGEKDDEGNILTRIIGEPVMRESMVRVETGVADIRYRAGFPEWRARLHVRYNASLLTQEAIVNLINTSGYSGVGDWRPSAPHSFTGSYGCYQVVSSTPER